MQTAHSSRASGRLTTLVPIHSFRHQGTAAPHSHASQRPGCENPAPEEHQGGSQPWLQVSNTGAFLGRRPGHHTHQGAITTPGVKGGGGFPEEGKVTTRRQVEVTIKETWDGAVEMLDRDHDVPKSCGEQGPGHSRAHHSCEKSADVGRGHGGGLCGPPIPGTRTHPTSQLIPTWSLCPFRPRNPATNVFLHHSLGIPNATLSICLTGAERSTWVLSQVGPVRGHSPACFPELMRSAFPHLLHPAGCIF